MKPSKHAIEAAERIWDKVCNAESHDTGQYIQDAIDAATAEDKTRIGELAEALQAIEEYHTTQGSHDSYVKLIIWQALGKMEAKTYGR